MGRQLSTHCSESYLPLANFRLPSTDTEDVSTSVEQSLVHLSSPSSSLAELNPLAFSFLPCFLLPPFLWLPLLHYFAGIVVQLQKHLCCSIFVSQDHQSHRWVFTVGRIKVLVFEADPEGCGFYPWLVIVAVSSGPKWVDSCHTQALHYFKLIYINHLQHFQN